jgi:hypothetical protein
LFSNEKKLVQNPLPLSVEKKVGHDIIVVELKDEQK